MKRRSALYLLAECVLLPWVASVQAEAALVVAHAAADLNAERDAWVVAAEVVLSLPQSLYESVERGVPMEVVWEAEVLRSRWLWRAQSCASATRMCRLTYNPLTRQYQLEHPDCTQAYATLEQALAGAARVSDWRVGVRVPWVAGATYQGRLRVRVDEQGLPQSFQVSALMGRGVRLITPWKYFAL